MGRGSSAPGRSLAPARPPRSACGAGRHPYAGAGVVLATKHGKEDALARALGRQPGMCVLVPPGLDTDLLGTFTGEVERPAPPAETAVRKARLGLERTGTARGIASEGAFGPHPQSPLVPCGLEILAFVDLELGIQVTEARRTLSCNVASATVAGWSTSARAFAVRAGFPRHGLIVRPAVPAGGPHWVKDAETWPALERAVTRCAARSQDGRAHLETDMRAHRNPTRMREIARVSDQLARRLAERCDACGAPGFGTVRTTPGLPCAGCGSPTTWARGVVAGCARCPHEVRRPRPDRRTACDPVHCPRCNP